MATDDMVKSPRIACFFRLRRYSKSQPDAKEIDMETVHKEYPVTLAHYAGIWWRKSVNYVAAGLAILAVIGWLT
jgi:hypothetical protein